MDDSPSARDGAGSLVEQVGWRVVLQFLFLALLQPVVLFVAAGTLRWGMAWAFMGVYLVATLASRVMVYRRNPDLLVERGRSLQAEDTEPWDRFLVVSVGLLGPLATWIVAGLDHRWGWSPDIAWPWQLLALGVVATGYAFSSWAMVANAYFSGVVRLQEERGQTVVTEGPYRVVRHPGYAGAWLAYLAVPLVLGSWWTYLPAGLSIAVLVVRTSFEDRTLQRELPGYADYAQRTRYRLLPGIW